MGRPNFQDNPWRAVGLISAIGIDLVFFMVAGYFAGSLAQDKFGGNPLWIVLGIVVGMILGMIGVYLMVRPYMEQDNV